MAAPPTHPIPLWNSGSLFAINLEGTAEIETYLLIVPVVQGRAGLPIPNCVAGDGHNSVGRRGASANWKIQMPFLSSK